MMKIFGMKNVTDTGCWDLSDILKKFGLKKGSKITFADNFAG